MEFHACISGFLPTFVFAMNQPIPTFPNETYLNGLKDADATVVDALYNEFRQPVARAVEAAGGTYADGATFFRVALIQIAGMAHKGNFPADISVFFYLKHLAVAQYQNWLREKGQEISPLNPPEPEELSAVAQLPQEAEMVEIRRMVRAKREFGRLSTEDKRQILSLANLSAGDEPIQAHDLNPFEGSLKQYQKQLKIEPTAWETGLPIWVIYPLTNQHFHQIWTACEDLERRLASSQIPESGENKTIRNAFLVFVLLTLGYAAYTWFSRDTTPTEVYDNNFQPPASILADMETRYAKDSVAPNRPEACTIAFNEADAHYQKKEWREAAGVLVGMMEDSFTVCQSDALFYLAIIGLELEKPDLTLECISKIEDLERFGEEIYWYMALAYVKKAALDPSEKGIAKRAVERALSNTEIPERRKQAEKMLEELAE